MANKKYVRCPEKKQMAADKPIEEVTRKKEVIVIKRVLWISRHEMTAEQLRDLERVMGAGVELLEHKETVRSVDELSDAIDHADAIAAVLPTELLAKVFARANGKPVLRSIAGRVPTGRTLTTADGRHEQEFAFSHLGWEQVLRVEFVTKRL